MFIFFGALVNLFVQPIGNYDTASRLEKIDGPESACGL